MPCLFFVKAATIQELQETVNKKSQELKEVQNERQQILDNLNGLEKQSKTIQGEIQKNNYQINQLNLAVKASVISIEKLGLEINVLDSEMTELEKKSDLKKEAAIKLLRELQEKEKDSPLIIFLKNQSLADNVSETQQLFALNSSLSEEINDLRQLRQEGAQKLDSAAAKKSEQEKENFNLKNKKVIVEEQKQERQGLLSLNKKQEKIYQQKIEDLEKLQAEISVEIESIEAELRKKIDPTLLPLPRPGVLEMPVPDGHLTQEYGTTAFARRNYANKWHNGFDFGGPLGTAVVAAEQGEIIAVDNQDKYCFGGAYGKYIVVKHENNLTTLYAHLSLQAVKVGDKVARGQTIGYLGKTGWATGPHLHFTVWAGPTFYFKASRVCGPMPVGGDLNPGDYLIL